MKEEKEKEKERTERDATFTKADLRSLTRASTAVDSSTAKREVFIEDLIEICWKRLLRDAPLHFDWIPRSNLPAIREESACIRPLHQPSIRPFSWRECRRRQGKRRSRTAARSSTCLKCVRRSSVSRQGETGACRKSGFARRRGKGAERIARACRGGCAFLPCLVRSHGALLPCLVRSHGACMMRPTALPCPLPWRVPELPSARPSFPA